MAQPAGPSPHSCAEVYTPERHSTDAQRSSSCFPRNRGGNQHRHSAGVERKLAERALLRRLVGLCQLRRGLGLHGPARLCAPRPDPTASLATRVPWWAWSGGLFGAIFIALSIFLVPQIGAAAFIALLLAGRMLGSITFDHFGWLGLTQRPINAPRLIGVALLIGGVVLIRR